MNALSVIFFMQFFLGGFNPTHLQCVLNEQKFSSVIHFSFDNDQFLVGQLDNYIHRKPHSPDYLSGDIFFDVKFKNGKIWGHTGDKRGTISDFSLTRRGKLNTGRWTYQRIDPNGEKTSAHFDCLYVDGK